MDKILEIGAGSGCQAAFLAHTGAEVYTVEIIEPLGYKNARVMHGNGFRGWPEHAPFAAIVVACGPDKIPSNLVAQLKDGGRVVVPVGGGMEQELILLRKSGEVIKNHSVLAVRFVPKEGPWAHASGEPTPGFSRPRQIPDNI